MPLLHRSALLALALIFGTDRSAAQGCGNSNGNTPLNDLGPGFYKGFQGGLYSGGANTPPGGHLADALAVANTIEPLGIDGQPDPGCGRIVMVSIGMSNTAHEFSVFERQEDQNPLRNERVALLNCAQGGASAQEIQNPNALYWGLVRQRIVEAGLSDAQVQVVWVKDALQGPPNNFPGHALTLEMHLAQISRNLKAFFPNVKIAYYSGRTYGGYNNGNPEPQAYENSFSVKWMIDKQIQGDPQLNWDSSQGAVVSPLLLWGPYLWADGEIPRSDGLVWCACDFENCGNVHPSPSGEQKVADMLSSFFASDPTAQAWFSGPDVDPVVAVDADADAHVLASDPGTNFGSDVTFLTQGDPDPAVAFVRFDLTNIRRQVLSAKLSFRNPEQPIGTWDRELHLVSDSTWEEDMITFANAPAIDGGLLRTFPRSSRDNTRSADVTDAVRFDSDGLITFAIVAPNIGNSSQATLMHAREGGQPPRLVLTYGAGRPQVYCTAKVNSLGCTPRIQASGTPSATASLGFRIRAMKVRNNKVGLLFYGVSGPAAIPFQDGFLCVAAPLKRATPVNSGGSAAPANDCSGIFSLDFNAFARGLLGGTPIAALSVPGTDVASQWWGRDGGASFGTTLSDAVGFVICP